MPHPKKDLLDRTMVKINARRHAVSLRQDIVTKETTIAQQSDATTWSSTVVSIAQPLGRSIYNAHSSTTTAAAATVPHASMQNTAASCSNPQPAPLDASTQPRESSIGPERTVRSRVVPPPMRHKACMVARTESAHAQEGVNGRYNTPTPPSHGKHAEAGSSWMADAQQEHEREVISDNHEHQAADQEDTHVPQQSMGPPRLPRQSISHAQANAQRPVEGGKQPNMIYLTPQQAQVVQAAMDDSASGQVTVTLGDVTSTRSGKSSASCKSVEPIFDMHKIRTAVARQYIEEALIAVDGKPDGTYDFSTVPGITWLLVASLIAKTDGQWQSTHTFLQPIPMIEKTVADDWEAARVAAIAEIAAARTMRDGV